MKTHNEADTSNPAVSSRRVSSAPAATISLDRDSFTSASVTVGKFPSFS
jgi:hypothetical protein